MCTSFAKFEIRSTTIRIFIITQAKFIQTLNFVQDKWLNFKNQSKSLWISKLLQWAWVWFHKTCYSLQHWYLGFLHKYALIIHSFPLELCQTHSIIIWVTPIGAQLSWDLVIKLATKEIEKVVFGATIAQI